MPDLLGIDKATQEFLQHGLPPILQSFHDAMDRVEKLMDRFEKLVNRLDGATITTKFDLPDQQ